MRFFKTKGKATASKTPSAPEQGDKFAKPKYVFESGDAKGEAENNADDSENERNIDMSLLQARARSRAAKYHEDEPTTRYENEDPKANELFQHVPGYKEGLRPEGQKKRQTPYVYPPDNMMRGPARPTRRVGGDDPAADQLLAGASKRQGSSQPEEASVSVPTVNEESPVIRLAREMRGLGLSGRNRQKGKDPAADALFSSSARP